MDEIFKKLEGLSKEGGVEVGEIKCWLHENRLRYKSLLKEVETLSNEFPEMGIRNSSHFENQSKFLDTYEVLVKVLKFYSNEDYYKNQIEVYNQVKNNVVQLKTWLKLHVIDESWRYKEFVTLFQNITKLSGYELVVLYPLSLPVKVKLDESEFRYTLQFLEILERLKKVEIIGQVKMINGLENVKRGNSQTYKRQCIIISVDDAYETELLIRFVYEKIELLKKVNVGQKIKVYAELRGGKNEFDELGYSISLLGWGIELLRVKE